MYFLLSWHKDSLSEELLKLDLQGWGGPCQANYSREEHSSKENSTWEKLKYVKKLDKFYAKIFNITECKYAKPSQIYIVIRFQRPCSSPSLRVASLFHLLNIYTRNRRQSLSGNQHASATEPIGGCLPSTCCPPLFSTGWMTLLLAYSNLMPCFFLFSQGWPPDTSLPISLKAAQRCTVFGAVLPSFITGNTERVGICGKSITLNML